MKGIYLYRGAGKFLARPGRKHANVSVKMAWNSFGALPCRKRNLMTACVSILLKSRAPLTCLRACFLPGRAKDLSAPRYIPERNHVCTVYSVTAVLYLQFVFHVMLFRPWNMFCTFTSAQCSVQYGCFFLQFFNFVLSRYVAQVLSELFWYGSNLLLPVSLLLSHSTRAVFLFFTFKNLLSFFLDHNFRLQELQHLLTCIFLIYYHVLWCPVC